jgi:hypothetical protein
MILSFEEVGALLDDYADTFPAVLFEELNGGVNLLEDTVADPEFPEEEMYIMGEYITDVLGNYINLYYGSFAALAKQEEWDRQTWEEELRITFSHELTHHMENRSGLHELDDRDAAELAAWREEFGL